MACEKRLNPKVGGAGLSGDAELLHIQRMDHHAW
jgi:hypothetical protein